MTNRVDLKKKKYIFLPLYLPCFIFWDNFPSCPSKSIFFFFFLHWLCCLSLFPVLSSLVLLCISVPHFSSFPRLMKCCQTARKIARISTEGNITSTIKAAPPCFRHLLLPKCFRFTRQLLNVSGRRRDSSEFLVQSPRLSTSEASPIP